MPPIIRKSMIEPRTERLAINAYDLDRLDPSVRAKVLSKLDLKVHLDMRFDRTKEADEAAVAFTCDLLTAALICDMLRSNDREMGDYPTRIYLKKKASWSRVPSYEVLTVPVGGHCELNPKVFPTAAPLVDLVPLAPKAVQFGPKRS